MFLSAIKFVKNEGNNCRMYFHAILKYCLINK